MYNCRAEGMAMWKCKIAVQRKHLVFPPHGNYTFYMDLHPTNRYSKFSIITRNYPVR